MQKSNAAHDLVDAPDAALIFLLVDKSHAEYWLTPAVDALDFVCLLLRAVSVTVDRVGAIVSLSSLLRESARTISTIALT